MVHIDSRNLKSRGNPRPFLSLLTSLDPRVRESLGNTEVDKKHLEDPGGII